MTGCGRALELTHSDRPSLGMSSALVPHNPYPNSPFRPTENPEVLTESARIATLALSRAADGRAKPGARKLVEEAASARVRCGELSSGQDEGSVGHNRVGRARQCGLEESPALIVDALE